MDENKKRERNQYPTENNSTKKYHNENYGLLNLGLLLLGFSGVDIREEVLKFVDYVEAPEFECNTNNKK